MVASPVALGAKLTETCLATMELNPKTVSQAPLAGAERPSVPSVARSRMQEGWVSIGTTSPEPTAAPLRVYVVPHSATPAD